MSRTLTLICPGMAVPLLQAFMSPEQSVGLLGVLAGRGQVGKRPIDRHLPAAQAAVLETLGLAHEHGFQAAAAVMQAAACTLPVTGFWMRLEPVHLVAGLDRISVTTLAPETQLSRAERDLLQPLIDEYLSTLDLTLRPWGDGQWLVRSERSLDVHCVTPEYAAAEPNAQVLPAGADAGPLRRLMTELQMLLHEHPVNEQRQRRGLPLVNSLWLHGEGLLDAIGHRPLMQAFGADDYLHGLYRLHDQRVSPLSDARTLLSQVQSDAVAVVDVAHWQAFDELWLEPACTALRRGRITELRLIIGRWQICISRSGIFKFWRRAQSPAQWAGRN